MWLACRADLAWLMGRTKSALELARAAVAGSVSGDLHRSNVSSLARWLAVLRDQGTWEGVFDEVVAKIERMQGVCWWDEAERLRALVSLNRDGVVQRQYEIELARALQFVPTNAATYFKRYGL